ncbi:MAG: gamma-glutamyl-gamma-aminobutyrate hydrolase family protein, partial [Planctomycetota bacterium]
MTPVIGITVDHTRDRTKYEVSYFCVEAVVAAGAVPMLLPFAESVDASPLLDRIDGLLMTGGNDPDPAAWGEDWHPSCVPVDPKREAYERRLLAEA